MLTKIKFHHLLLIGALALGSCQKEYVKPKPPTPPPPPGAVKFAADIVPICTTHWSVAGCHDAAGGAPVNLSPSTAHAELFSNSEIDTANDDDSNLYKRMTDAANPMPPAGLLPSEAAKVLAWIKDGAKNN